MNTDDSSIDLADPTGETRDFLHRPDGRPTVQDLDIAQPRVRHVLDAGAVGGDGHDVAGHKGRRCSATGMDLRRAGRDHAVDDRRAHGLPGGALDLPFQTSPRRHPQPRDPVLGRFP